MTNEGIKVGLDMAQLCRSILLERKLELKFIEKLNMDHLFALCEYHCLTAMVCMALEYNGVKPDKKWTEAKAKAIRKNILLDAERAQITAFLEYEHIWYMPLKGSILKDFYPKTGMRQMSDNDILFDASKRKTVIQFMKNRGYHIKGDNGIQCDEFLKEPIYNFEMHLSLFTSNLDSSGYFADVKNRLIRISPDGYAYRFTDEDFYIYMVAHAFKHLHVGGTGFRTLIDFYIFLKEKEKILNWTYIQDELQHIVMYEESNILESEKLLRQTAKHYFSDEITLTSEEENLICTMINAGTYGNLGNLINRTSDILNVNSKSEYLFRRLFPNKKWWSVNYPKTEKYPFLIPIYFFYRFYRLLTIRRKGVITELGVFKKMSREEFAQK